MKAQIATRFLSSLVAFILCLTGSALAQKPTEPIATISFDSSFIRWQPHLQGEYARIVLAVSTPSGEVFSKAFNKGVSPWFKLTDESGKRLPEGPYRYELIIIPELSPAVKEALAAARGKGNELELVRELRSSGQLPSENLVQSGSYRIENGAVFAGETNEPGGRRQHGQDGITPQDVVNPDDVIVQGSLCVGLDCVNNESFGFDTIRLKENNTRIKFEDTSTQAGFPSNDWQLTANDSASGGANKFSIEDVTGAKVPFTITAGAPTNSIFVDSLGRLGLKTSTPVLDMHANNSNTPAIRLEQNSGGGFTAQTWDIAGNEANFFVRDVTSGSRLPFRIRPGAPTSSLDIDATGNVGIGTDSPGFKLDVVGNSRIRGANVQIGLTGAKAGGNVWALQTVDADGRFRLFDDTSGAERVSILQNGNLGVGTATPAGRLDVNGAIFQRGVQIHADYVFEPAYVLESIEEHADFMWTNKHLPAVGAKQVDAHGREVVEIGSRMRGMLEELEKAHIYISTLNDKLVEKDVQLERLAKQNTELAERLARIEALLKTSQVDLK